MARLLSSELDKIKEKYNVSRIWSWSRINTFMTSPYEFFLHYVKHVPEDRQDCAYTSLGTIAHDTLDDFYEGKIKYEDMIEQFKDGWLTTIDIANLKLDRNDEGKDASLKTRYKENLELFFRNHNVYKYKLAIEKPIVTKICNHVFVGYIDAVYKDDDGVYHILDFKTSSKYSGKSLEEHSGQLTIYAMGLMQAGVPADKVKACFNFLKYATIQYEQANGVVKTRDVERSKVGESLQSNAKMWLKKLGYEDEVDDYLKLMLDTNSIDVLPDDVRAKYKLDDCHVYISLDKESIDKWNDYIISTIHDIYMREKDYEETGSDKCFWDTDESVEKESYYFSTLMAYSPQKHKPYAVYLDKLEAKKSGDIFGNVSNASKVICDSDDAEDLSWLNDIL